MPSFHVNLQWASIGEVTPNLYISGVTALKPLELERLGISMIVNCTSEVPTLNLPGARRVKLWLQDNDQEDIYAHLDSVTAHIHTVLEQGGKVLVHCVAGVSRSAAILLAYLTRYKCATLRDAYHLLSTKRTMVRPNLGFWRQLITYEQCIKFKPSSVRLVWTKQPSVEHPLDQPAAHSSNEEITLIPDVYLSMLLADQPPTGSPLRRHSPSPNPGVDENRRSPIAHIYEQSMRERHTSGKSLKFVPVLSTLHETHHQSAPNLEDRREQSNVLASPRRHSNETANARPLFTTEPIIESASVEPVEKKPVIMPSELDLGFGSTHSAVTGFVVVT